MDLVMDIVGSITVLHDGEVLAEGTPAEIQDNEQVKNIYFGRDH
jgi:ABC-type branched-subunit amino acid transport system ATPase component